MEQLINKKYKMLYPSEQKLIKFGFRKVKNVDDDIWKHSFPVYKYNHKITTIEGVISVVLPSGKVTLDVYSNGSAYTPFYNNEFSRTVGGGTRSASRTKLYADRRLCQKKH